MPTRSAADGPAQSLLERTLVLAPGGRDATIARAVLQEAGLNGIICANLGDLLCLLKEGAEAAILTEEAVRDVDTRELSRWVGSQPPWSDFPFVVLTTHGGGLERNPTAAKLTEILGNASFLERPFHPTTLVSVVQTALRGRRRQYECRRLNDELESRVHERTAALAAANGQLLQQIEERERVESTLRQMQRLEAVGQLTSGVAHDFNNLLTVILGNIGFLEKGVTAAGINGMLLQRIGYMRAAAQRGSKLTAQLLSFSRRQRLEPKVVDLAETIASMRDLLQSTLGGSIRIETMWASPLWPALVDPTQLELALLNLAINSRDAMQVGGALTVSARNVTLGAPASPQEPPAGDYLQIGVSDTGSGMSEEVLAKAFEPFFTTKEIGKGSGMGLSQVLGFVKQSGGGVRIESRLDRGTAVYIFLPRAEAATLSAAAGPAVHASGGAATVLLVDDDSAVREVTASMLREAGHRVIDVGSGGAALATVEHEPHIDVLVADFAMPGMNGAEVARRVRRKLPALPVLFITGFADRSALADVSEARIVSKPFVGDELLEKLRSALANAGSGDMALPH